MDNNTLTKESSGYMIYGAEDEETREKKKYGFIFEEEIND